MQQIEFRNFGRAGQAAYLSGLAAEESAERAYLDRGFRLITRRYRGRRGEIDLVMRQGDQIIFVEVKKSSSHSRAAWRMTPDKIARLYATGEQFLATQPQGMLTDCRFDVALVDKFGQVEILENALMQ